MTAFEERLFGTFLFRRQQMEAQVDIVWASILHVLFVTSMRYLPGRISMLADKLPVASRMNIRSTVCKRVGGSIWSALSGISYTEIFRSDVSELRGTTGDLKLFVKRKVVSCSAL